MSSVGRAAVAFLGWVGQRLPEQRFDFGCVLHLSLRGEVLPPLASSQVRLGPPLARLCVKQRYEKANRDIGFGTHTTQS
jgi:hypothetical protein